jgi:hypothetical protein
MSSTGSDSKVMGIERRKSRDSPSFASHHHVEMPVKLGGPNGKHEDMPSVHSRQTTFSSITTTMELTATTIIEILWVLALLLYPKVFCKFPARALFSTHPSMPIPDPYMSDKELSHWLNELRTWLRDDEVLHPDYVCHPERAPHLDREQLLSSQWVSRRNETRIFGNRTRKQVTIFGLESFSSRTPLDQLTRSMIPYSYES